MFTRLIGLLLTFRCTAKCRHCCFECGPSRTEEMALYDALSIVREIGLLGSVRGIGLTGGEPFIDYDRLLKIVCEAHRYELAVRVVTNGFWATSQAKAMSLLKPMSVSGLSTLSISCDEVHQEFVPIKNIQIAIQSALDIGLKVIISTAFLKGNGEDYLKELKARIGPYHHKNLYVKLGYVSPNGRALDSFHHDSFNFFQASRDLETRLSEPCSFVVTEPIITPLGDFAVCCSPATANPTGFMPEFVLGNIHSKSLKKMLYELNNDVLFSYILLYGPLKLFQFAQRFNPKLKPPDQFVNLCDFCSSVLTDPDTTKLLRGVLKGKSEELAICKTFIEAYAGDELDEYINKRAGLFCYEQCSQ